MLRAPLGAIFLLFYVFLNKQLMLETCSSLYYGKIWCQYVHFNL